MLELRKRILFVLVTAFGLSMLAAAPVWAHGIDPDESEKPTTHTAMTTEAANDSLHDKAEQLLATKRANIKEHTQAQKQKSCEARQTSINKRVNNYAKAAQRHLDVFNSIFTKVQAFETKKNLNVPTYEALVDTAKTKQAAAQTAVDTLKALDVSIDCTQADPAASVATVKTATANARTTLHEYRKAIKDIVVALKGASTSTDKTTTGGDE